MATGVLLKELGVEDLYGFLGVPSNANEKEITRGYRKKALKYHPDKNPNDASAAAMFQKLSKIYGVLTDIAARAAYDKWMKARAQLQKRNEELSVKRRKFKDELESKESEHYSQLADERAAKEDMEKEIERLREIGYEMVLKQQQVLLKETITDSASRNDEEAVIQAVWSDDDSYTADELQYMFSKYGECEVLLSKKRKKKVMISYGQSSHAIKAIENMSSQFSLTWISGRPESYREDTHPFQTYKRTYSSRQEKNEEKEKSGESLEDREMAIFKLLKQQSRTT